MHRCGTMVDVRNAPYRTPAANLRAAASLIESDDTLAAAQAATTIVGFAQRQILREVESRAMAVGAAMQRGQQTGEAMPCVP